MVVQVRTAEQRFVTRDQGRTSWHCFSFGAHYDPENTGFGALIALNDEVLPAGTGFAEHSHTGLEIVTWVIAGALRHTDSSGASTVVEPGWVQRLSSGSGIRHCEVNAAEGTTRFVQSWLRADDPDLPPSYAVAPKPPAVGGWSCLAGDGGVVTLGSRFASLWVAALDGAGLDLPEAPRLHVLVTTGGLHLGEHRLGAGASARLTGETGRIEAAEPETQVLVWGLP